jgi:CubicO group peptidase (beta-lactamase class C family)
MKMLHIVAAGLLLAAQWPARHAEAAGRRDFTDSLTRSVAIAGRGDERFRLQDRMAHYLVPGVSVAVIENCRIVEARGFGTGASGGAPVTPRTLFQAGSISKTFTAVAALRLVEQRTISLDGDVRQRLTSWRLPDSPLLAGHSVTLRGLLSHTAGINQEGGNGYAVDAPLPTLIDILEGRAPANTAPIRVEHAPGTWRYSGGGYYIAQALMGDATGTDYAQLMDRLVFRPLRLRDSSFSQPLHRSRLRSAARAVGPDGTPLEGGWRVNPELAAGGLWTTPADIARLVIFISRAARRESSSLLSPEAARELMTRGPGNWGLGVDLGPPGQARRFGHTGHNVGFASEFVMYPDTCQGAVVMTNADQGGWLVTEILRAVGDAYGWPERPAPTVQAAIPLTSAIAERFVGTYRLRDFPAERFSISRRPGGLYWARAGHVGRDLLPESELRLFSPDSRMTLEVADPSADRAQTLHLSFGGGRNVAERIGD